MAEADGAQERGRTLLEAEQFRRLVSSVRDYAIFMLDPNGCIRSWNAGAQNLKGYTPAEAIGKHFSIFYTAEDRERDHPAYELEVVARDGRYEEEGWRVRKDGSTFWASVTITAVRDDDGKLVGFAKVTRDVSARREAEEALHRAVDELRSANAELDRFAAVAAHDLTDPLRTISGYAEVLERTELSETQRSYVGHIRASSLRLTKMLRDLLTYARADSSPVLDEPVDVAATAKDVLDDLAGPIGERGATVTLDVPPGAVVRGSPADVRLVLQNLVSNAVKFADPQEPEVVVAAAPGGDGAWRVTVEDNGAGVAEEDRERIFGAFERARTQADRAGYGLGLAICERIVDRHGGSIGVERRDPHGSRFWFTLSAAGEGPVELVR